ncbi:SDR family NAD(P)-dependent oxidoreductase [Aeromicrobium sp. P5_D10]
MSKCVVVSGGGTGIGKAIAKQFASEGAKVTITGRRADVLRQAAADLGRDVSTRSFDASDPRQVAEFAAEIGDVDVLVNNAGGNTDFDRPAADALSDVAVAWRANFESNVMSAVLMTAALRPVMREGGTIITIGSIAADKGAGSYGAAKAAVASWNVDLAREVGSQGLTANVVSPGYIASTEFFRDVLTDERRESLVKATMTGRAGVPDDIAATVAFLASGSARQITGQTIAVNGGEWTSR